MEAAKTLKLWELSEELDRIGEEIAEAGGELTPEIEEKLDALEGAFEEKAENIALMVRNLEATSSAVKEEEKRIRTYRRSLERQASGLKDYLLFFLRRQGVERVEGTRARIRRQANSRPSIRWLGDPESAPEAFRRVRVDVDTQAAYEELKSGGELPEGFEVERGEHVRIF